MTMMIIQLSTKTGCTSYHLVPESFVNSGSNHTQTQHKTTNTVALNYATIQSNHRQGRRENAIAQTCDRLIVNKQTIDFRLGWVRRCLTHLVLDEDLEQNLSQGQSLDGRSIENGCHQVATAWNNFEYDRARLKRILDIYSIILKQFPSSIKFPISGYRCGSTNRNSTKTQVSMLEARQRVLDLIEQLGGYCDSIDSLRCILKSRHIQGVIYAYDKIVAKLSNQSADCELSSHTAARDRENYDWRF